ncbi:MAG: hypothetical protein AB7F53_02440, partial [Nitrososphaeraceae archaeon]
MDSKINTIIISSILAFALIAGIPAAFVNVLAQGDGGSDTGGMTGGSDTGGMTGGSDTGGMTGGSDTGGMTG